METKNPDKPVIVVLAALIAVYALAAGFGVTHHLEMTEAEVEQAPHAWAILPFSLLLGAIAVLPLMEGAAHWWERNLNKFYVAANLALITLLYLAFLHPSGGLGFATQTLFHTVINEYIPFIILLFSLYTIAGGIRIAGDLPAHPKTNLAFMAAGAVLASFIGTTGAAMLLVRPLLETNRERKHVAHTMVFFIFLVCNCGGLLLPLGDPPLFLGYLQGVDFLWTLNLWKSWLFVNGALLAVYFLWDHFYAYPRETQPDVRADETRVHALRFAGLWPGLPLLVGVILAVALLDPGKPFPGTDWHPWFYLREMVMLALAMGSLALGSHHVRRENGFDYLAITEVAILFIGIFVSMKPALQILGLRGSEFGLDSPAKYFWASGWLSSVLDNAPTYLVFFEAAKGETASHWATSSQMAGVAAPLLKGISLGSVCMGAMTYIGNGPNFMVKTIAEKFGVAMPSFFAYLLYSFGVLLPILALNLWLFL
ncbi:MAG TPA: sodium:proton antiporter [Pirellulales bacterium]|nr:sodium:proton antiporter [Pirellulales bacterium]